MRTLILLVITFSTSMAFASGFGSAQKYNCLNSLSAYKDHPLAKDYLTDEKIDAICSEPNQRTKTVQCSLKLFIASNEENSSDQAYLNFSDIDKACTELDLVNDSEKFFNTVENANRCLLNVRTAFTFNKPLRIKNYLANTPSTNPDLVTKKFSILSADKVNNKRLIPLCLNDTFSFKYKHFNGYTNQCVENRIRISEYVERGNSKTIGVGGLYSLTGDLFRSTYTVHPDLTEKRSQDFLGAALQSFDVCSHTTNVIGHVRESYLNPGFLSCMRNSSGELLTSEINCRTFLSFESLNSALELEKTRRQLANLKDQERRATGGVIIEGSSFQLESVGSNRE